MSSFGRLFRVTTCGESHSEAVAVIIEGVPAGLALTASMLQPAVDRRRPGQSAVTTSRAEADEVELFCGTEKYTVSGGGVVELTLGTPLGIRVRNRDARPGDYDAVCGASSAAAIPRPSHADWTYRLKYGGVVASSGGGRASARETLTRVIAGAVAEVVLRHLAPQLRVVAFTAQIGNIALGTPAPASPSAGDSLELRRLLTSLGERPSNITPVRDGVLTRELVDAHQTRFPCTDLDAQATAAVLALRERGDSVGGVVGCIIEGCPVGLGEPVFDKLEASLAHAMLSIPATKGFEIGSGFACAAACGSAHNDLFSSATAPAMSSSEKRMEGKDDEGRSSALAPALHTLSNRSAGIQGGIANGGLIHFRVAFKPPATIAMPQRTANLRGDEVVLEARGRHDPCVVPRAVPVVEAMANIVMLDALLLQDRQRHIRAGD